MSDIDCQHLDEGICHGKYKGFGCIEDKCQDLTKGPKEDKCQHERDDGYCTLHKKFDCQGENCKDYAE